MTLSRILARPRAPAVAFAAIVGATTLLAGCAPLIVGGAVLGGALVATDRRTTGSQVDDETIELKSNGRMNEAFGDRARINTTSYNRMVLLTGEVANEADKTTAEQVVARIDNVQSVVNELSVGPMNSFSEKTKDAFVTAKVKASLVDAKDLLAHSIKVVPSQRGLPDGPRQRAGGGPSVRGGAGCLGRCQGRARVRDRLRGRTRQYAAEEPGGTSLASQQPLRRRPRCRPSGQPLDEARGV
jgi:osmotically-inducible protein OsmY